MEYGDGQNFMVKAGDQMRIEEAAAQAAPKLV
jgi:hypothetical protein